MISAIASLLHLRAVDDPQAARRMLADGHALVCEDDVKAVVVKLRAEYYALRAARFAELAEAVAVVRAMEASAFPHPVEHPSMTKAWVLARAFLAKNPGGAMSTKSHTPSSIRP